ncbi:GNAT family N-acetyltransferase [Streptomyces massasporeus]|uniref:GNAT family N-acetyltransferase n=1 Tax=Streptomyces massasporeus TaxID=67324 RepID=UPI0036A4049F
MTSEQHTVAASLRVGGQDDDLEKRLDEELTAFNTAAADGAVTEPLSVRVTDEAGDLVGGLTAWTWGTLCSVDMLWVREDRRHSGWGGRLMRAAEAEAARRGCTDMIVSTYSFQAPAFYPRLGFTERARIRGVPGGHEDIYFHKRLLPPKDETAGGHQA